MRKDQGVVLVLSREEVTTSDNLVGTNTLIVDCDFNILG